ncbi:SH3 domain-containing protein [Vacuolonema iberomarrocanum]|uniref:SH3 domain-containing protein n=1 Tax=Vacuolonema iberomarrocanum TaxID=3454632 RepID=UPI001A05C3A2|nr:hypothetical protein [filamentous cyanobacterium LEGE 07170]
MNAPVKVRVIEAYTTPYPNPVKFEVGEQVSLGQRDDEYPGWIWVTASGGKEGWAPEVLLDIDASGSRATALETYSARELNTHEEEILTVYRELNEWYWVCNADGQMGWVPIKTVTRL